MAKGGKVNKKPEAITVSMDHKDKRNGSWDSKLSSSTASTRHLARSDTPSSILSCDSDIRFTRKLGGQYRCGCYIVTAFLMFLLVSATGIYLGYSFLAAEAPAGQVFQAVLRVLEGDSFQLRLADPSTQQFRRRARDYRERLNLLFRRSDLRVAFDRAEVLALDGVEGKHLVVHFNLHFNPYWYEIQPSHIASILLREATAESPVYFANLTIDPDSIDVRESTAEVTTAAATSEATTPGLTTASPPPRRCGPLQLEYCSRLAYNTTSYPNKLGHRSVQEVRDDVIAFRELVDAECYRLAYEFVCQLLQPGCVARGAGEAGDRAVLPCREFCREFHRGCGGRLPERFRAPLDCDSFPRYSGPGSCSPKPGCVRDLQDRGLSPRVCDGVVDCPDLSDETGCSYCAPGHLHCGAGRACVAPERRCDGRPDCPDASDERHCLVLSPSLGAVTAAPYVSRHSSEGYVVFNEHGHSGKVCTETLNRTVPAPSHEATLATIATSLCSLLSFQNVTVVKVRKDPEDDVKYVHMEDPMAAYITFVRGQCPSKEVLYIGCSDLRCGLQSARVGSGVQGLGKAAVHGDWPWHAALLKDDVHVCDATLVAPQWLITTASCFQGQPKARWVARLGMVRLAGGAPWQQERAVVGMVKSPVEGSTVAMVKLEGPVAPSDFVRPVCLPQETESLPPPHAALCNTLSWARNKEQLQRIELKPSSMQSCENISIPTVNSFCTEPPFPKNDCSEEEFAGSPMLCLQPGGQSWTLVGISNWRIACSKAGVERPRMYDRISSNMDWILDTISAVS
ncbi:atrial natriuretic peptide-converting enzyme-like [Bacillus rossius redtenbacheri]|uniref:atrial natriuretic peptide-converting enzyme-like n=1 Tax=Bacillus rossius redtenbacheri TaxID=93214 RepID=UPI002FDE2EEF